MFEIGLSLGIILGIKDYTERVSKLDDVFFNFIIIFSRIANNIRRTSDVEYFLFARKLFTHKNLII